MINPPIWQPSHPEKSRMAVFLHFIEQKYQKNLPSYAALHQWSVQYPQDFWQSLCEFLSIHFDKPALEILNHHSEPLETKWFTGAYFNFAEQLLKRRDHHPAIISILENGQRHSLSYHELYQLTAACAQSLKALGVQAGDRVAGIMPNISETIIAMLATTALGAIWSSCSPDFGAQAAIDRLGQITPKVLFTVDGYVYQGKTYKILDKIQRIASNILSLEKIIVYPLLMRHQDSIIPSHPHSLPQYSEREGIGCKMMTWQDCLKSAQYFEFASLPFNHPIYILFSSGTTGKPKCIIHSAGGTLLQHLKELALHSNLSDQDNLFFYTTCGWMMWNWMVSALALGTTLTLYEGHPMHPDGYRLFEILEQENVSAFGTSAKFISSIEKLGIKPKEGYSLTHLKTIFSTGSPLLPQQYDFVYQKIKQDLQLSSISGGTDIVSCFALGNPMLPVYRGELQCFGLGMDVDVFNEVGESIRGERGELVCKNVFPAMPLGFWDDPEKTAYRRAYFNRFPGIWTHGDYAEITPRQGLIIYGRSDTVLNPGGVRIGTAEIYRQVEQIPEVLESIVIGQDWQNDVRIVLFVKLKDPVVLDDLLAQKIRQIIRQGASPRHVPAIILQVPDIPKTMNGKLVELAVRQIVHGQPIQNVQSIANPEALAYFQNRVELQS